MDWDPPHVGHTPCEEVGVYEMCKGCFCNTPLSNLTIGLKRVAKQLHGKCYIRDVQDT
jgi:hypothetical protein